jgi:transcriptional regulator with XRE-family HTH domain
MESLGIRKDGFTALLPELRRRRALTQQQLAERVGCSLPTVQRLEAGSAPATLRRVLEIADGLGWTGTELIALVDGIEATGGLPDPAGWLDRLSWSPPTDQITEAPVLVDEEGRRRERTPPLASAVEAGADRKRRERLFGLLLSRLRERAGITAANLATAWGRGVATVRRCEAGKAPPDLRELTALGLVLGLARVEMIALTEELSGVLGDLPIGRRRHAELLDRVARWLDEDLKWIPNFGQGLLASRPAGFRYRPVRPGLSTSRPRREPPSEPTGAAGPVLVAHDSAAMSYQSASDLEDRLRCEIVSPAAAALAGQIRRGWNSAGVRVSPISIGGAGIAWRIGTSLLETLELAGWRSGPALFVGPRRVAGERTSDKPVLVAVTPGEVMSELARSRSGGKAWRLVVVDGAATAECAGLRGRQPSTIQAGMALVVIESDLASRRSVLSQLVGRKAAWEYCCVDAMDAGLLPGLRFRAVADPIEHEGPVGLGGWSRPDGGALLDDRRLDVLREAGAFSAGANCLVHVAGPAQEKWIQAWINRELQGRQDEVQIAQRVARKVRFDGPVDELILVAADYPKTLVRQVADALALADVERGLDVWELQGAEGMAEKRRNAVARALGAADWPEPSDEETSWASPGERCIFRWA